MTESVYYGLQKLGPADPFGINDYAFSWFNVDAIDRLLYKLNYSVFDHLHPIESPTVSPTLNASMNAGILPAGRTLRYKYSFVDNYGNETAASPESSITTPLPIASPNPPGISYDTTSGTLTFGNYFYILTAYSGTDSNETLASNPVYIAIIGTETTNAITLELPLLPTGATGFVLYKKGPGQSVYYYQATLDMVSEATPATTYVDDGSVSPNFSRTTPIINTTNANNAVTIILPDAVVPVGYTWKIYRSETGGDFTSSLLHWVTETTGSGAISPTFIDVGLGTTAGSPPTRNLIFGDLRSNLNGGAQVLTFNELDDADLVAPWASVTTGTSTAVHGSSSYVLTSTAGTGLAQQAYIDHDIDFGFDKVYAVGFKFTPSLGPITDSGGVQIMEIGNDADFVLKLYMFSNTLDGTVRYRAAMTVNGVERNLNMLLSAMPYTNSLQFQRTPILNNVGSLDTTPQYIHCIVDLDVDSRFVTKPAIQIFVNGILTISGDFATGTALMAATPDVAPSDLTYLSVGLMGYVGPAAASYTQSSSLRMTVDYIYTEEYPQYGVEFNEPTEILFGHTQTYKPHRQYESVTRKYLTSNSTRTSTTLLAETNISSLPVSNYSPYVQFEAMLKYAGTTSEDLKFKITLDYNSATPWTSSTLEYMLTPYNNATPVTAGKIYTQTDTVILDCAGAAVYNMIRINGWVYNNLAVPFPASNLGTMYLTLYWAKNANAATPVASTLGIGSYMKIIDQ